jgi:hypothetical protein
MADWTNVNDSSSERIKYRPCALKVSLASADQGHQSPFFCWAYGSRDWRINESGAAFLAQACEIFCGLRLQRTHFYKELIFNGNG